jgi:hypothetical protein|nr:MAG TPA: Lower collar protein [Caudoviricetes sp.]
MSKYTTEVRFICESKSGLENSSSADNVNEVIAGAWNKIFTSKAPFFDESYRSVLCQKILKHYYLREICCETVGIWKLWMNERLETIMPYYNQLYESELIKFNPLYDVDITRKHDKTVDGTEERNGETSDTANGTREVTGTNDTKETGTSKTTTSAESNETKRDLYSDTPQGAITGLENENYLTNARKITNDATSSGNENTDTTRNVDNDYTENETTNNTKNGTNKITGTSNTTEDYLETLVGKQGSGTYSKMLMEFRDTFLNIDMMVIDEFKDLFFELW